ncbi:MAG TPA: oligosaccharide flippase family protein [Candidatus Bipolaricaulis sp.]|nr:oligosaccharide flippase family protein [Candidatus Bipolaricaulis sp.]HRS13551.1 oligosaccharide flippase family protein [Candidatus Bipolaricaulis sp.]HRU22019.1 oligosaccharide flippase family protein [Candidatus Bipolaricaulis sp.]
MFPARPGAMQLDSEPLSPGTRIAKNAAYLLVSNVGVRIITALVAILVARYLGPEQYGVLSLALALLGIAGYLTDLGLTPVMIREGTKPGTSIPELLSGTLRLRLLFALATTVVVVFLAWFYYPSATVRTVILVVVLPGIWAGVFRGIGTGYFQMTQEMQYVALINAVAALAGAGMFLLAVLSRWSLPVLSIGYGLSAIVGGALGFLLVRRRVAFGRGWHRGLLMGLPAFTLGGGLGLLLPQLGPLLLPHAAGLEETGFFTAAYRIPGVLLAVPGVVATAFYPQLFAYGASDRQGHRALSARELRLMGSLGLLLAIPTSLHARWIAGVVFGASWVEQSGPALALLAWMVALASVSWPLADALTTQGLQVRRAGVQAVAVVLGAGAYWFLGRAWGALGAAGAALAVETVLAVGFLVLNPDARTLVRTGFLSVAVKALVLVALAWAVTWVVGSGWLGFGLTVAGTGGMVLVMDREIRGYTVRGMRMIVRRARAARIGRGK